MAGFKVFGLRELRVGAMVRGRVRGRGLGVSGGGMIAGEDPKKRYRNRSHSLISI